MGPADRVRLDLHRRCDRMHSDDRDPAEADFRRAGGPKRAGGRSMTAVGDAWANDIFRIYLAILAAALVAGGIVLAIFTWLLRKDVRSVWKTYFGWLLMIPLVVGAVILGRIPVILL